MGVFHKYFFRGMSKPDATSLKAGGAAPGSKATVARKLVPFMSKVNKGEKIGGAVVAQDSVAAMLDLLLSAEKQLMDGGGRKQDLDVGDTKFLIEVVDGGVKGRIVLPDADVSLTETEPDGKNVSGLILSDDSDTKDGLHVPKNPDDGPTAGKVKVEVNPVPEIVYINASENDIVDMLSNVRQDCSLIPSSISWKNALGNVELCTMDLSPSKTRRLEVPPMNYTRDDREDEEEKARIAAGESVVHQIREFLSGRQVQEVRMDRHAILGQYAPRIRQRSKPAKVTDEGEHEVDANSSCGDARSFMEEIDDAFNDQTFIIKDDEDEDEGEDEVSLVDISTLIDDVPAIIYTSPDGKDCVELPPSGSCTDAASTVSASEVVALTPSYSFKNAFGVIETFCTPEVPADTSGAFLSVPDWSYQAAFAGDAEVVEQPPEALKPVLPLRTVKKPAACFVNEMAIKPKRYGCLFSASPLGGLTEEVQDDWLARDTTVTLLSSDSLAENLALDFISEYEEGEEDEVAEITSSVPAVLVSTPVYAEGTPSRFAAPALGFIAEEEKEVERARLFGSAVAAGAPRSVETAASGLCVTPLGKSILVPSLGAIAEEREEDLSTSATPPASPVIENFEAASEDSAVKVIVRSLDDACTSSLKGDSSPVSSPMRSDRAMSHYHPMCPVDVQYSTGAGIGELTADVAAKWDQLAISPRATFGRIDMLPDGSPQVVLYKSKIVSRPLQEPRPTTDSLILPKKPKMTLRERFSEWWAPQPKPLPPKTTFSCFEDYVAYMEEVLGHPAFEIHPLERPSALEKPSALKRPSALEKMRNFGRRMTNFRL